MSTSEEGHAERFQRLTSQLQRELQGRAIPPDTIGLVVIAANRESARKLIYHPDGTWEKQVDPLNLPPVPLDFESALHGYALVVDPGYYALVQRSQEEDSKIRETYISEDLLEYWASLPFNHGKTRDELIGDRKIIPHQELLEMLFALHDRYDRLRAEYIEQQLGVLAQSFFTAIEKALVGLQS